MEQWPKATRGITNQENKTKGEIDQLGILHTVFANLQTMLYHVALRICRDKILDGEDPASFIDHTTTTDISNFCEVMGDPKIPITGMLYNVIKRPLSDRYTIKQKKAESQKEFLQRALDIIAAQPEQNFFRWRTVLTPEDVETFCRQIFDPLLEQLWDWWEWIRCDFSDPFRPRTFDESPQTFDPHIAGRYNHDTAARVNRIHWQAPWGVYDSLASGFRGDFFEFLTIGREHGLRKIDNLFPELEAH
jgi:hypothetical protein